MTFRLSKNTADFIKVIAALMVMMHHYSQYVCANHLSNSIIYTVLSSQAGYLGVAVFFFLSGFGLMESEQRSHLGFQKFLRRRFLKVYLPVLAVTCVWMLISPFLLTASPFNGIGVKIGGGKSLILNNILIDFGDGVLWFVKVLFCLYACFYLYCFIRQKNKRASMLFLVIATIVATIVTACLMFKFQCISVPFFFLGVVLSQNKQKKGVIMTLILLATIAIVEFAAFKGDNLGWHSLIDATAVALLIITCSIREIKIRIPSVIAALSFDIYLVHNKVLMALMANTEMVELLPFVLLTITVTITFYLFRTRLLRT